MLHPVFTAQKPISEAALKSPTNTYVYSFIQVGYHLVCTCTGDCIQSRGKQYTS